MDATQRILELAAEGLSDAEIAAKLKAEGIKNAIGQAFDRNSVHSRRLRAQKTLTKGKILSDITESSEQLVAPSGEPAISETTNPLPEAWKREIVEIVREEIKAMTEVQTVPKLQIETPDLPPMPPEKIPGEKGRPVNPGKRTKIAGTVDAELERLFQEWRKSQEISISRALDTALWHFLGKPKLSFEISELADDSAARNSDG